MNVIEIAQLLSKIVPTVNSAVIKNVSVSELIRNSEKWMLKEKFRRLFNYVGKVTVIITNIMTPDDNTCHGCGDTPVRYYFRGIKKMWCILTCFIIDWDSSQYYSSQSFYDFFKKIKKNKSWLTFLDYFSKNQSLRIVFNFVVNDFFPILSV